MKFILTTAGATVLCILGQYLVNANWAVSDHFLGGYFTASLVSIYLSWAEKL